MSLFFVIYLLGLASCGWQGAEKAKQVTPCIVPPLLVSFFAAFGGGIIRDLFILHQFPVIFSKDSIPEITIALFGAATYSIASTRPRLFRFVRQFSVITDACGLGSFIVIGANNAIAAGAASLTVVLCAIVTSLGGGILSSLLCDLPALKSNISYRCITIIGALMYVWGIGSRTEKAQYYIVLFTCTSILAYNHITGVIHRIHTLNAVTYYGLACFPEPRWCMICAILALQRSNQIIGMLPRHNLSMKQYLLLTKVVTDKVFLFHRIRQM